MVISFEVRPHSERANVQTAAILMDGEMVAILYPEGENGVKLVSAHLEELVEDDGSTSIPPIPHVSLRFDPQPYTIEGGRIVKHPKQ